MGLQELLIHFHPFFVVVVFPLIIIAGSFWLPYIKNSETNKGIWFISVKARKAGKIVVAAGILFTILFVVFSELLPNAEKVLPSVPSIILTGLIPFIIVKGSMGIFIIKIRNKFALDRSEFIQTIVILFVVSYTVLSIIGIFFRGPGMKLMWP
jgi:hypothetical protein